MKRWVAPLPWIAAGLGVVFSALVFYPGFMTWDSAYQWWQVRHGVVDPAHPPIMVWIWILTDYLLPGPGGYFLFQLCLYWISLGLFASALRLNALWQAALVLVLGFWPPLWGLSLHLWKDVGSMSFFCLAAACYARDYARPHRAWRIAALAAVILACLYRYNAVPAALPFLVYGIARHYRLRMVKVPLGSFGVLVYAGLACAFIQWLVFLPNQILKLEGEPRWPLVALWDMAAVSVQVDRLVFPPEWVEPGLTMEVVRRDFNPEFSGRLFTSGLIKLSAVANLTDEDFAILRNAWLRLPFEHPNAYWRHRFGLMKTLLGWQHDPYNPSLVLALRVIPFRDNPPIVQSDVGARPPLQRALHRSSRGPLFQGGWYLLLSLTILGVAVLRRRPLMAMLAGSGLLYVLPLLVVAPSADFRYLSWMIQASLLSMLVVFVRPASQSDVQSVAA